MDKRWSEGTVHLHIVWEVEKFLARYGTYTVADVIKTLKAGRARGLH